MHFAVSVGRAVDGVIVNGDEVSVAREMQVSFNKRSA